MKKLVLVFFAGIIVFSGCSDKVTETVTYLINEPVFMSEDAFRKSVVVGTEPQPISNYGKMCFYEGFIYIAESGKGIHIINNTDPANPVNFGFIELLGNADLAIRNGKLYADALIDLVWFDISNPAMPNLEGRLENVFAQFLPLPNTGNEFPIDYGLCYDGYGSKGIVVSWNVNERNETISYESTRWGGGWFSGFAAKDNATSPVMEVAAPGGSSGVNGSMSRFTLYKNYLYSVINNYMSIIDLSENEPVKVVENIYIGWNVETIFSYKDNMFMGTPTGMFIYSVEDPLEPKYISSVQHIFGCDPVVVENDIAYVTIHSGNNCGQLVNDLMIYDVSNVREPKHIITYAMTKPKGLGIDNSILFLCDDGLKVFNAANPQKLPTNMLAHFSGMEGFDVIPFDNVLMMIAEEGLYQYDYSDLTTKFTDGTITKGDTDLVRLLSVIPIVK